MQSISPEMSQPTTLNEARRMVVDNYYTRSGFTPLTNRYDANSFDGVFFHGNKVYVIAIQSLKQDGSVQLRQAVEKNGVAMQMTLDWIKNRALSLIGDLYNPGLQKTGKMMLEAERKGNLVLMVNAFDNDRMVMVKISGV